MKLDPARITRLMPLLALAGLGLTFLLGWTLFPAFLHMMKHQQCLGSGRVDC